MTHVTEHHSEEEWEGDDRHWHWIGLKIGWHTISVHNSLENSSKVSGLEVSWAWDVMVVVSNNLGSTVLLKSALDQVLLFDWSPEITDERLVLPFHLVEGFVKSLLLSQEHFVNVNSGRSLSILLTITLDGIKLNELVSEGLLGSVKNTFGITNGLLDFLDLWVNLLQIWELISLSGETVADSLNSFSSVLTVPENNDVH